MAIFSDALFLTDCNLFFLSLLGYKTKQELLEQQFTLASLLPDNVHSKFLFKASRLRRVLLSVVQTNNVSSLSSSSSSSSSSQVMDLNYDQMIFVEGSCINQKKELIPISIHCWISLDEVTSFINEKNFRENGASGNPSKMETEEIRFQYNFIFHRIFPDST